VRPPCRDDEPHGLYFHDANGQARFVRGDAIAEAFEAAGASVKLVVLSACFTEAIAETLRAHVDCVVGMSGAIHDDAARIFAIGFYGGLGEQESVAAAYRHGRAAIHLEGHTPRRLQRITTRGSPSIPDRRDLASDQFSSSFKPIGALAGWRLERMPTLPETKHFAVPPDWICEVLSRSTEAIDRDKKLPLYARHGVRYVWLVDPIAKMLEVHLLDDDRRWREVRIFEDDVHVRAEPFAAVELDLSALWVR